MEFETRAPHEDETGHPPLRQLDDVGGTLTLTPSDLRPSVDFWVLEEAGMPVGSIEQSASGWWLRGWSERWRAAIGRRPRHLGWHLAFTRHREREPVLCYYPRTLRHGGVLVLSDGHRYKLRGPLLRSEWRLAAVPAGELGRIRYLGRTSKKDNRQRVGLSARAASEPQLLLLILATWTVILIHDEQPRTSASTTA